MRLCMHCGHAVTAGDRHALISCPPAKKDETNRARRKRLARKAARRSQSFVPKRGQAVAGTGVPKGGA